MKRGDADHLLNNNGGLHTPAQSMKYGQAQYMLSQAPPLYAQATAQGSR
jgi:hypothetical protein